MQNIQSKARISSLLASIIGTEVTKIQISILEVWCNCSNIGFFYSFYNIKLCLSYMLRYSNDCNFNHYGF